MIKKLVCYLVLSVSILSLAGGCNSRPAGPDYKEVKGQGEPVTIRWDFSKEAVYQYGFEQVLSQRAASSFGSASSEKTTLKGDCTITCKGDSQASVKVAHLKPEGAAAADNKDLPPQLRQSYPDIEFSGMKEDGSFSKDVDLTDIVLRTLFPLPQQPIAPGDTQVTELSIPFQVNGKAGKLIGRQATTFVDYYEIYGVNCIHLDSKFEYYEFIGDDGKGSSRDRIKIKGNSVVYFDNKAKRIHRSDGDCDITFDIGLASVNQVIETTLHKI